ncbi:MAG: hypothetical protein JOY93_11365 [Acidobacteriales bacterium]|nr:hypothetical protein [Terriglobales bacterium]
MKRCIVIPLVAFAALSLGIMSGQTPRTVKTDKGPRATGLLQLAANGVAYLVPITIMIDGRFYDASAYKASPVPMALATETVYEAVQTGVPQGLFTVTGALKRPDGWVGEGRWKSQAEIAEAEAKQKAAAAANAAKKKENDTNANKPPTLRRGTTGKSDADIPTAAPPATVPAATPPPTVAPAPTRQSSATASATTETSPNQNEDDKPTLRRGKPMAKSDSVSTEESSAKSPIAGSSEKSLIKARNPTSTSAIQFVPAISDAAGPDMRPYKMNFSATEETELRNKMLAMAADEVRARAAVLASPQAFASRQASKVSKAAKSPQPTFGHVQFRAFDLSNSNEPVLILTAEAVMPGPVSKTIRDSQRADTTMGSMEYSITLVARNDIYGDLHKALANVTDPQHLDVVARLELIDAVDVDGDGRGELLFRQVSNAGSAFVVYRVIGYQLWPLFQGAIQGIAGNTGL